MATSDLNNITGGRNVLMLGAFCGETPCLYPGSQHRSGGCTGGGCVVYVVLVLYSWMEVSTEGGGTIRG